MKENLRPLTPEERDRVFAAADAKSVWCGRLVRFFAWTGIHVVTLCDPDRFELRVEHNRIQWIRAKNKKSLELPIKSEMVPWIEEFLNTPRPGERHINRLLNEIGEAAGVKLNFLRLRHTAMVMFYREMGMNAADCKRLLGVSEAAFLIYTERPTEDIEADLRRKGF